MKYFLTVITLIGIGFPQSFTVQNVQASQSTDGEHILTVTYDLISDGTYSSFTVHPEISLDGGNTWNYLIMPPIENVLGDNIFAGSEKIFSIDLDDYYNGMYTNNALVKIQATGREAVNLPSSFENLFVTVESGEYMGGNISFHNMLGEPEEFQVKNLDYTYEISKFYITNAQYAEFLIDVYEQNLITIWWSSDQYGAVKGAFHGYGIDQPLLQQDCEYEYRPEYSYGSTWGNNEEFFGYGDPHSYCSNGYDWYRMPGSYHGRDGKIRFNGTTFVVDEGFGNHPVQNLTMRGAMAFAHYYGLRLPNKEEIIKAANGMNSWDYVWGESPNYNSSDSELKHYMNYTNGDFRNPWGIPNDNYVSRATTPVGYFNGSTYYYPEGFVDKYGEDPIYEIQTENAVSPYGLYDINGNVKEMTSHWNTIGGWQNGWLTFSGSGWTDKSTCRTTVQTFYGNSGSYGWNFGTGSGESGFRVARTVNTTID